MLALDPKLAKHIGEFYQIAVDGKKKPVFAIVSKNANRAFFRIDLTNCCAAKIG